MTKANHWCEQLFTEWRQGAAWPKEETGTPTTTTTKMEEDNNRMTGNDPAASTVTTTTTRGR
jgi:hypothetical protein